MDFVHGGLGRTSIGNVLLDVIIHLWTADTLFISYLVKCLVAVFPFKSGLKDTFSQAVVLLT